MRINLSSMESLAMTGVAHDFEVASQRRNRDVLQVLAEHGVHYLPSSYVLRCDPDGYVRTIEWADEEECVEEPSE